MNYVTKVVKKVKGEKMNLKVEAVSDKFGPSFKAVNNGVSMWHNPDKKVMPDLSSIRPGDEIEADVNGKWVKSFTIISRGNAVEKKPVAKSSPYVQEVSTKENAETGLRIAATNAAFAPAFTFHINNGDESEAFQKALDVVEKVQDFMANGRAKA